MSELYKENRRLQAKIHSLNNFNEVLQQKLLEYDEMHNRLITSLGVSNIAEAIDSIMAEQQNSSNEPLVKEKERILQLEDALTTQLDAMKAAEVSIHSIGAELYQTREDLAQAMEDLERLRNERYTARKEAEKYAADAQTWRMELETKLPEMQDILRSIKRTCPDEGEPSIAENSVVLNRHDASASDSSIRGQLDRLKVQYQALLASKQKITERYKEDLIKWKRFKTWAVKGEPIDREAHGQKLILRRKRSDRGVRPKKDENILDPFVLNHAPVPPASSSLEGSLTQPSDFPSSQTIHGILPSPVLRNKSPTSSSSAISDDTNEIRKTCFNDQSPNVLTSPYRNGDNSQANKQGLDDKSPKGESCLERLQKSSSPLNESVSDVILVPDTPPAQMLPVLRDRPCSTLAERSNSEGGTRIITSANKVLPLSDKSAGKSDNHSCRKLSQYMQFKGRGRYSNVQQPCTDMTSAFESKQIHHSYIHEHRKRRSERKALKGSDCECCREYYETLRPLPTGLAPPPWRSPSVETSPKRQRLHQSMEKRTRDDIEDHRNEVSRHRSHSGPPITPPSFWKIGFPDTQEIEDINRKAEDMHARKYQRIEKKSETIKRKIPP